MNKVTVIVVAAGSGIRMNHSFPKQFLLLAGKPILAHTLLNLSVIPQVNSIIVVVNKGKVEWSRGEIVNKYRIEKVEEVVDGGATRQESVLCGLKNLKEKEGIVVIHDGVRLFVTAALLERVVDKALKHGAAICAIPIQDTLKKVAERMEMEVETTLERNGMWFVQTPQAFSVPLLLEAHKKAKDDGFKGSDDSVLVERLPHPVKIVEGSPLNIKITTPQDLLLVEAILKREDWQDIC